MNSNPIAKSGTDVVPEQIVLVREQLNEFKYDGFVDSQLEALRAMLSAAGIQLKDSDAVVDVGGGHGYFAERLKRYHQRVRVYDTDMESVVSCRARGIEAAIGDALRPEVRGDERLVCLNLILHHLVGRGARETEHLQEIALKSWPNTYIFVHEYCYQSLLGTDVAAKLIFRITSSPLLSCLAAGVSRVFPSLRANTFGVGVRFRSSLAWQRLFRRLGFELVLMQPGVSEKVSFARRLLLIRSVRRDSFLIKSGQ